MSDLRSLTGRTTVSSAITERGSVDVKVTRGGRVVNVFNLGDEDDLPKAPGTRIELDGNFVNVYVDGRLNESIRVVNGYVDGKPSEGLSDTGVDGRINEVIPNAVSYTTYTPIEPHEVSGPLVSVQSGLRFRTARELAAATPEPTVTDTNPPAADSNDEPAQGLPPFSTPRNW